VLARERIVKRAADREEIRARIERLLQQRFRRNERRRADDRSARAHRRHRAEVDQLGATFARALNVLRREVSMEQASRVQERDRGTDIAQQRARLRPRQRRERVEVLAVQQLHRVVRAFSIGPEVMHRDHVRMRQLRERAELLLEERDQLAITIGLLREAQALERDVGAAVQIGDAKHGAHTAATDRALHRVAAGSRLSELHHPQPS
jgi:hypothetical protein